MKHSTLKRNTTLAEDLKALNAVFAGGPSDRTINFLLDYSKAVNISPVAGKEMVLILN